MFCSLKQSVPLKVGVLNLRVDFLTSSPAESALLQKKKSYVGVGFFFFIQMLVFELIDGRLFVLVAASVP